MKLYTMVPNPRPRKWKKHFGTFGIEDDGTIYLAAECSGHSPMEVFLCASYDGEPMASAGKNSLYRSVWLKEAFPSCAENVEHIEKRIPEYLATCNGEAAT